MYHQVEARLRKTISMYQVEKEKLVSVVISVTTKTMVTVRETLALALFPEECRFCFMYNCHCTLMQRILGNNMELPASMPWGRAPKFPGSIGNIWGTAISIVDCSVPSELPASLSSDCIAQTAYLTNSLYWLNFCFNILFSSFFQWCIGGLTRGKGAVIPSCEGELGNICIHTEYVVEKGRGWGWGGREKESRWALSSGVFEERAWGWG